MSKKATKKTAKKKPVENKPAAPATPKTLDELLKAENPYEQAVADNIRGRHDENLEAAIVANQRSIQDCLSYVAGMAKQKANGASCVVMSADDVFGLAVHWFLDGNTPIETDAGAPVDPAAQPVKATPPPAPKKPKAKKAKKAKSKKEESKTEKEDKKQKPDDQLFFGFWEEAKTEKEDKKQ